MSQKDFLSTYSNVESKAFALKLLFCQVSLDAAKVINVTPRYARLRVGANGSAKGQIIGWENIELISDRPLETMLKEFKQLKEEYPDRILIASIMEEYDKAAWEELIDRVEQTGIVSHHFFCYLCFYLMNTSLVRSCHHLNILTILILLFRMPLRSIFHVLMVCQREKWVLQLGKIVHFWRRFVDG